MNKLKFVITKVPEGASSSFIGTYEFTGNSDSGVELYSNGNDGVSLSVFKMDDNGLYEVLLSDGNVDFINQIRDIEDMSTIELTSTSDDSTIILNVLNTSLVKFVEISDIAFNSALLGDTSKLTIDKNTLYFVKTIDSNGEFISGKLYKGAEPYTTDADPVFVGKLGGTSTAIGTLTFADSWVGVNDKGDGNVEIKFPFNISKMTASLFNSTGGASNNTVTASVTTDSRYVAIGGDYPMGNWSTTALRSVIRNTVNVITFSTGTNQVFWIPDTTTFFTVKLTKGDGSIVTEEIGPITGNGSFSSANCTATISNWSDDFMGYKASVSISVKFKDMLGGAGRFSLEVSHSNGGNPVSKVDLFYDDNPGAGSIESVSLSLGSTKPTKWLSGVEYYTGGLTLDATLNNITGVFNKSFVLAVGSITSTIASSQYSVSSLTGSTNYSSIKYNDSFESYSQTLTVANGTNNTSSFTSTGQFKSTTDDIAIEATCSNSWNTNTTTGTAINLDKPLNTYLAFSTDTFDHFQDENYRLSVNTETGIASAWDSKLALSSSDLKLDEGTKLVNTNGTSQVYYRNFKPSSGSAMNLMVSLIGSNITKSNFGKSSGFDIELSLDGKNWYTISSDDATNPIFSSSNSLSTTGTSGNIGVQFGSDSNGNQLATGNSSFKIGDSIQTNSVLCRITISNINIKLDSIKIVAA